MIFHKTTLEGAYVIELNRREDERGFFARTFCQQEFRQQELVTNIVQVNNSMAVHKGTLRGMHYQLPPKAETKIVRCIQGALHDIIIDLRSDSPTFGQHHGVTLTAENRQMFYVPKGFAHGFLTLEEQTEAFYFVDEFYSPDHERGIRWNDPTFSIQWPLKQIGLSEPAVVSAKDNNHPDFNSATHLS